MPDIEKEGRVRIYLMMVTACLAVMLVVPCQRQFQISFLDVGQGDGIFIQGKDGTTCFIDGGSTSEDELGKYQILPLLKCNGVRKLDVWIVTHADEDHISGMCDVIESGYPVKMIVISEHMVDDENKESLLKLAAEWEMEVAVASNEDVIRTEGCQLTFFTPESSANDRNEASLVTLLQCEGHTFLFTGDIGQEQEEWLMNQTFLGEMDGIDILKCAHHGSKNSNGQEFLNRIQPKVTVISAGENNLYGHPHEETLKRLEAAGSDIVTTMDMGEIIVRIIQNKVKVSSLLMEK